MGAEPRGIGRTGRRRGGLAVVGLVITGGGLALSGGGVPLYDGVGYPDEPYRFVSPPAGYRQTPAPTSASVAVSVRAGRLSEDLVAATDEQGSQASVYVPASAVALPAGQVSGTVRLTVSPQAPDSQPADGTVDGNVYATALSGDGGMPLSLSPGSGTARLTLRDALFRPGQPVVEHRITADGPWVDLPTDQVGRDIYAAPYPGPGQYALVEPGPHGPAATVRRAGGPGQLPLVLGIAVGVVVLVLLGVRSLSRERS